MEPILIANRYKVVDTLYKSELQNIYVAEDTENFNLDKLVINEILDGSIIYAVKDMFNEDLRLVLRNFVEYFYQDLNFFVVSKVNPGTTLHNHLSTASLRISDKMYITENLLTQLLKLENSSRLIKHHLLDLENICIAGSRTVSFNLGIRFDKEGLYATAQSIISKLGNVICCVFANTPNASLEQDKDNIPPAIASIVKKCQFEGYNSIKEVYDDFKASLLYSTFIGGAGSVDKQIMKNIQKAKRKRSLKPVKRLAAAVIIIALLAGGYLAKDDLLKYMPAFGGDKQTAARENQIPIAKFSISKNKIYVGDKIDFLCEASDPDLGDRVASFEWSVSRNNDMFILFSREQDPSYTFDMEGDYVVSLIVKDTAGISSNSYKVGFKVLPREEIPADNGDNGPKDDIRK